MSVSSDDLNDLDIDDGDFGDINFPELDEDCLVGIDEFTLGEFDADMNFEIKDPTSQDPKNTNKTLGSPDSSQVRNASVCSVENVIIFSIQ